jgi:hypothetical protein
MRRTEVTGVVRRRKYLYLQDLAASMQPEFAAAQEEQFAACPAAQQYTDPEVGEFLALAHYLDYSPAEEIIKGLRRAHIAFPPDQAFNEYRLCRHILRRSQDPAVREAFFQRGLILDWAAMRRLKQRADLTELLKFADVHGPPAALGIMRRFGMEHLVADLVHAFSPEQVARCRALLLFGRLLMHRCIDQPEPSRQPTRWEQEKLARRIRLRDVQVRSMQRSQHRLRRERKALLARVRQIGLGDQPELDALALELAAIRAEREAAERQHRWTMQELSRQHHEAVQRLQAELAAAHQDQTDTLAARAAWLQTPRRRSSCQ